MLFRSTAKLPASAQCKGGKSKNKCLVSLTTTAGFGNCVVVQAGAKRREDVGAVVSVVITQVALK